MKIPAVVLLFAMLACAACNKAPNATASPHPDTPSSPPTEQKPRTEAGPVAATPESKPPATPDALIARRAHLLARIDKLSNSDCDIIVLQFRIIPRDEILDPLSEPRKELVRYVTRIAPDADLDAIERAIDERMRHLEMNGKPR